MRNTLVKVFHKEVMVQNKMEIREFLEPVQVRLSVSGAALVLTPLCPMLSLPKLQPPISACQALHVLR